MNKKPEFSEYELIGTAKARPQIGRYGLQEEEGRSFEGFYVQIGEYFSIGGWLQKDDFEKLFKPAKEMDDVTSD